MNIYGLFAICIASAALCVLLRQYRPEFAVGAGIAAGICVTLLLLGYALPAVDLMKQLGESVGEAADYIAVPVKALGICYVGQFAGDVCRDAGQASLAGKVELATRLAVLLLSVPLIERLIEIVKQLVV